MVVPGVVAPTITSLLVNSVMLADRHGYHTKATYASRFVLPIHVSLVWSNWVPDCSSARWGCR